MKKTFIYLSFIIFLGWFPLLFAGEIYVSLQGNDKNPGTKEAPFNTLNRAIKQAREWRRLNRIFLCADCFELDCPGGRYEFL